MMKAYIDTNILVDLVLSRQEFQPDAQRVFALGYAGEVQLMVSALSFVNTVYLARKYKYPVDEVYSKLRLIADFVDVVDLRGQNVVDVLSSGWKDYEATPSLAGQRRLPAPSFTMTSRASTTSTLLITAR